MHWRLVVAWCPTFALEALVKFYFCRVSTFVFLGNCEFACPLCLADLVAPFNLYLLWILSWEMLHFLWFWILFVGSLPGDSYWFVSMGGPQFNIVHRFNFIHSCCVQLFNNDFFVFACCSFKSMFTFINSDSLDIRCYSFLAHRESILPLIATLLLIFVIQEDSTLVFKCFSWIQPSASFGFNIPWCCCINMYSDDLNVSSIDFERFEIN